MDFYYVSLSIMASAGLYFFYKFKPVNALTNLYMKYERAINFINKRKTALPLVEKLFIIYTFVKFMGSILYTQVVQYMYSNLRFDKTNKRYELDYTIGGSNYTLIVDSKTNTSNIICIINEEDEDVTDKIMPYLGPSCDWHGKIISPYYFGMNSITFELSNGKSKTYEKNSFMTILLEM